MVLKRPCQGQRHSSSPLFGQLRPGPSLSQHICQERPRLNPNPRQSGGLLREDFQQQIGEHSLMAGHHCLPGKFQKILALFPITPGLPATPSPRIRQRKQNDVKAEYAKEGGGKKCL